MKRSFLSAVLICAAVGLLAGQALSGRNDGGDGDQIYIAPHTLVLSSNVIWVTVHTNISLGAVYTDTVTLDGVDARFCKADSRGNLVAKFTLDSIRPIVEPGSVTLTLTADLKVGGQFVASDTITVRE